MKYSNQCNDNKILTTKQATKLLAVGRTTIYNLINYKKLKAVKVGGKYRTTLSWIYEYLEKEMELTNPKNEAALCYNKETDIEVQERFQARKGATILNSAERNQK